MIEGFIQLCTSRSGLFSFLIATDLAIAASYFAIPLTMAVVFRNRKDDIPYPWLWMLFVAFIVACGLTHLMHVWSALRGLENLGGQVVINFLCAATSVVTAIAFTYALPQINELPSPKKQQAELERLVRQRTREKDVLIHEINHRIGNQLQILSSVVSIESRHANADEAIALLSRLKQILDKMGEEHSVLQASDYLAIAEINHSALLTTLSASG
jgi:hypothetical protein